MPPRHARRCQCGNATATHVREGIVDLCEPARATSRHARCFDRTSRQRGRHQRAGRVRRGVRPQRCSRRAGRARSVASGGVSTGPRLRPERKARAGRVIRAERRRRAPLSGRSAGNRAEVRGRGFAEHWATAPVSAAGVEGRRADLRSRVAETYHAPHMIGCGRAPVGDVAQSKSYLSGTLARCAGAHGSRRHVGRVGVGPREAGVFFLTPVCASP